jgi:hypothetical protein
MTDDERDQFDSTIEVAEAIWQKHVEREAAWKSLDDLIEALKAKEVAAHAEFARVLGMPNTQPDKFKTVHIAAGAWVMRACAVRQAESYAHLTHDKCGR